MSYQALYRKYRPQKFSEVVGQSDTITILRNSIINKTFSNVYLFSGTKGTGKTSVAKILAKTINCEANNKGEACDKCLNCKFINDNADNIDILEIDGASNNGVDEIRNIKNNINLLPMHLKYKVYIIDEVHMLTTSAFNALLKTLEEPANHIIFIFATTEPYKIPATVISRCQWFEFKKINEAALAEIFTKVLTKEKIKFEKAAIEELIVLADGSLRDGINNIEKIINFNGEVTLLSVNKIFNVITKKNKINFLNSLLNQDINSLLLEINKFSVYLDDFKSLLIDLIYLIEDIVVYRLTKNIEIMKILTVKDIDLFSSVKDCDLKLILSEFDNIISLNLSSHEVKAILVVRILKLMEKIEKYSISISNEHLKIEKDNIIETESIFQKETIKNKTVKEEVKKENKIVISETIEKINNSKINEELLNNVINVIIQADKEVRKSAKTSWNKINQLIENNKFRNFSKVYLNTMITAACNNALILVCDNIIQADLINKKFLFQEHRNFLNFVLGKEFMIYAVDKNQWKLVGKKYQDLIANNALPKVQDINIPLVTATEEKEEQSKTLTFLKNIFSEVEEI